MTKAELASKISEITGVEKLTTIAVIESMMNEIKHSISCLLYTSPSPRDS